MHTEPAPAVSTPSLAVTLAASATFGAILGGTNLATWQVAVESGQVLAGLLEYPPENPFYLYHATTWTGLHQACALLLRIGFSESQVSWLLSAGLGALTAAALALATLALCPRPAVALLTPAFLFAVFAGADLYGPAYPLYLAGTHHTYGVAGRGAVLFTLALGALRRDRAAALLLGLLPMIHLAWAAWCFLIVAAAGLWRRRTVVDPLRAAWPWFTAGAALSLASFVVHRVTMQPDAASTELETAPHVDAFLNFWDVHRQPVGVIQPGIGLAALATAVSLAWLWRLRHNRKPPAQSMLTVIAATGALGLIAVLLTHAQSVLPATLTLLIPGRFLNLPILLFAPLLVGLAGMQLGRLWGRLILAGIVLYPMGNAWFLLFLRSDRFGWALDHWKWLTALGLVTAAAAFLPISKPPRRFPRADAAVPRAAAIALASIAAFVPQLPGPTGLFLFERAATPLWTSLRAGDGLLITPGGAELVQLRSRRPVLLNTGALDQLPYVPASAPAMNTILRDVYGVDLLDPPPSIREAHPGALPPGTEDHLWRERDRNQWVRIGADYGATQVLTRDDLTLDLPLELEAPGYRVYRIPRRRPAP